MNDYFLLFNLHYDRDRGLDQGRLRLCSLSKGHMGIWIATSSLHTKQYKESFHQWGGILPPEYRVSGLPNWRVRTNPIPMPHTKGVMGNFYQILPFEVTTDRGGKRSDFGIHLDANTPGSLGCIVMSDWRFKQFETEMSQLVKAGIREVPLFVTLT